MLNPQMVELLLRSSGAPPALLAAFKLIQREGFGKFAFRRMADDDPAWAQLDRAGDRSHVGVWMRAESKNTKVTIAIFLEGENEHVLTQLEALGAPGVLGTLPPG